MGKLTRSTMAGSAALGLALLVAVGEAALAASPNASSELSGYCTATKIGSASNDEDSWNKSNATGEPLADSQALSQEGGMGHDAFASGAHRRAEIAWYVGSSLREPEESENAIWKEGFCQDDSHSFSNTFSVMAAEGSGLANGAPVTLALDARLIGELRTGSLPETLGLGGKWSASGEVEVSAEARTEAGGTWLAGVGTYASATVYARADKWEDPDGSVDHDLYREWWTQSNVEPYASDSFDEHIEVCAAFSALTGCSVDPGFEFDVFEIDETHPVAFATTVGARVTLTVYLDWTGEFTVFQQGSGSNLYSIISDGYFSGKGVNEQPRGMAASVSAVTAGVQIVWDVEPAPPSPEIFTDSFEDLVPE